PTSSRPRRRRRKPVTRPRRPSANRSGRSWAAAPGLLTAAVWLASCGAPGAVPQTVAEDFYQALADRDAAAACDLLAPQTRRELEQSEHAACQKALPGLDLPATGATVEAERFGNQAQVRFDGDTAFL